MAVEVPVSKAEEMLNAKYSTYIHTSGQTAVRTLEYSLPVTLLGAVRAVHPTTSYVQRFRKANACKVVRRTDSRITDSTDQRIALP